MIAKILSFIVFTPLLGALFVIFSPKGEKTVLKYISVLTSFVTFLLTTVLLLEFDKTSSTMQFLESHRWIESLNISYLLGVDGLSIYLIPLTALVFFLITVSDWEVKTGLRGYYSLLLFLETTILGTLTANDLFLFFTFFEATILPIYFMLGVWGHKDRVYSATKFFLFQFAGGILILLGMLAVYYVVEPHTFSILELSKTNFSEKMLHIFSTDIEFSKTIFILMFLGFAVRIPVFPLHSWFISAQAESPTPIAVVLTALFIKTGIFGLLRINYALFPSSALWMSNAIAVLGAVNILYASLCALGQKDVRKLVAYFCMGHMGYVLVGIGIFSQASFQGAVLEMVTHGFYITLLVFLVNILGQRFGTYELFDSTEKPRFGGLIRQQPILSCFFSIAIFAAIGLPGFAAFPATSMVFIGAYPVHKALTIIGLFGLLLTAGYFLWMYKALFLGTENSGTEEVSDLSLREQVYLIPLVLLIIVAGVYPTPFINLSTSTLTQLLGILK